MGFEVSIFWAVYEHTAGMHRDEETRLHEKL